MSESSEKRKDHPAPPPPMYSSNPFSSSPCASAECPTSPHSESPGNRRQNQPASRHSPSPRPPSDRTPQSQFATVATSHRSFPRNRPPASDTPASEYQCYRPRLDCSPDSSVRCLTTAGDTSIHFPPWSGTGRQSFPSATGIPHPDPPSDRSFSDRDSAQSDSG